MVFILWENIEKNLKEGNEIWLIVKDGKSDVTRAFVDRRLRESKIDKTIVSQIEIKIPTYKTENLPKHLENIKAIKPGSRNL